MNRPIRKIKTKARVRTPAPPPKPRRQVVELEEQLRKLWRAVEQNPASIIITDVTGAIEYVNPKFTQVTGYSADEVRGQNPRVLKSGELPAEAYQQLWQTLLQGHEWRGEFHNRKKNGELFWEFALISPLKAEDGKITHFVGVKEDITERKRLEEEIRTERERWERETLRRIEEEQERIGRDLHDGLCQILVGAKLQIGALEKRLTGQPDSSALATAKTVEQMINRTIHQARNLARGLNPVTLESNGLAFALQELAKEVQADGTAQCDFRAGTAPFVFERNVASHLYRIAQEAVQNAIKHGRARKISIRLRPRAGHLLLSIGDNGVGFSSHPEKSVGAGLHNMRMRAAMIGGTLAIRPGKGGGTVVSVSLPLQTL